MAKGKAKGKAKDMMGGAMMPPAKAMKKGMPKKDMSLGKGDIIVTMPKKAKAGKKKGK